MIGMDVLLRALPLAVAVDDRLYRLGTPIDGKSPWSHCPLWDKVDLVVRFYIWCAPAVNTVYLRLWVVHRKSIHSVDTAKGSFWREPTSSLATLHLQRASSP